MSEPRTPRDLPDQQAGDGEDPLDEARTRKPDEPERTPDSEEEPEPDEPPG